MSAPTVPRTPREATEKAFSQLGVHDAYVAGVACGLGIPFEAAASVLASIAGLGEEDPIRAQVEAALTVGDLTTAKSLAASDKKGEEKSSWRCHPCKSDFNSQAKYDKHCQFSSSHKEAVAKAEVAASEAAAIKTAADTAALELAAKPVFVDSDPAAAANASLLGIPNGLVELSAANCILIHEAIHFFWRQDKRMNFQIFQLERWGVFLIYAQDFETNTEVINCKIYVSKEKLETIIDANFPPETDVGSDKDTKFTFTSNKDAAFKKRRSSIIDETRTKKKADEGTKKKVDNMFKVITDRIELNMQIIDGKEQMMLQWKQKGTEVPCQVVLEEAKMIFSKNLAEKSLRKSVTVEDFNILSSELKTSSANLKSVVENTAFQLDKVAKEGEKVSKRGSASASDLRTTDTSEQRRASLKMAAGKIMEGASKLPPLDIPLSSSPPDDDHMSPSSRKTLPALSSPVRA